MEFLSNALYGIMISSPFVVVIRRSNALAGIRTRVGNVTGFHPNH